MINEEERLEVGALPLEAIYSHIEAREQLFGGFKMNMIVAIAEWYIHEVVPEPIEDESELDECLEVILARIYNKVLNRLDDYNAEKDEDKKEKLV